MVGAKVTDGRQARWDRHNQQRRQQILDAAIAVVEADEPGAEFHVQQIADQAGLNRTVVYRHFSDRADLDRAIQDEILLRLTALLLPQVSLDGTVNEIIHRIVSTYVDWAVEHPALHRLAEYDSTGGPGPLHNGIHQIAGVLVEILETVIATLEVKLDDGESAAIDPLAYALVGAVFGAVRRWASREKREPSATQLSDILSRSVWHLLDGHARRLGLDLDPDVPIDQLLGLATLSHDDPEAAQA